MLSCSMAFIIIGASMNDYILQAKQIALSNGIHTAPENQTLPFLQKVYQYMPDNHLLGLLAKNEYHSSYWYYSQDLRKGKIDKALSWCRWLNKQGASIFWNVASRKNEVLDRQGAKGTYKELRASTCMFCDVDCALDNTPIPLAYEALLDFKLKPSMITFTGGGLQALWVLNEVWNIELEADAREYKQWLLGYLIIEFAEHNLNFDKGTVDATRELRLPGFINTKKSRENAVAQVIFEAL